MALNVHMLAIGVALAYILLKSTAMKKTLTIIFTTLSIILILDSMNFGHALAIFFLAGIIPGTNIAIDADRMFALFSMLLGLVLARVCVHLSRLIIVKRNDALSPEL